MTPKEASIGTIRSDHVEADRDARPWPLLVCAAVYLVAVVASWGLLILAAMVGWRLVGWGGA